MFRPLVQVGGIYALAISEAVAARATLALTFVSSYAWDQNIYWHCLFADKSPLRYVNHRNLFKLKVKAFILDDNSMFVDPHLTESKWLHSL